MHVDYREEPTREYEPQPPRRTRRRRGCAFRMLALALFAVALAGLLGVTVAGTLVYADLKDEIEAAEEMEDFALRRPQQRRAQAEVEAAENRLAVARLDLPVGPRLLLARQR